jgi:phosphoribosylaminoimidazole (AIR) synthetase
MYRVFNMGIGMVLIVTADAVAAALEAQPELKVVGETVAWNGTGPRVIL